MTGELTQEVLPLSLDQLVLGENIRCGLKQYKIEWLAKQIQEAGRIHTALKVEPHENDGTYIIREGYYRYAAALWLEEHGVTVSLPCIVEPVTASRRERILKQLSENRDRENLSPLDTSNTIHMLLEEGMSRAEIMERFSRPGGRGKTPNTMEPLSETSYSYYLRYRELPAEMQQMLHHGTLQVGAANRILDESDPDKRAQLLINAEEIRKERIAGDEAKGSANLEKLKSDEARYAGAFAKNQQTVEAKTKEIGKLEKQYVQKKKASEVAFKRIGNLKGEKQSKAYKVYQDMLAQTKQSRATLRAAQDEKRKAQADIKKGIVTQRKLQVEEKNRKKRAALTEKDIKKAAAADQNGRMKLGAADMRAAVKHWIGGPFPKVQAIAVIIQRTFDSVLTASQAARELAKVTGEAKKRGK